MGIPGASGTGGRPSKAVRDAAVLGSGGEGSADRIARDISTRVRDLKTGYGLTFKARHENLDAFDRPFGMLTMSRLPVRNEALQAVVGDLEDFCLGDGRENLVRGRTLDLEDFVQYCECARGTGTRIDHTRLEALLTDHWVVADQLQRRLDELARGEGLPGRHPLQVTGLDLRTSSTNREGIICRVAAIVNFHCQYHRGLQAVLDQLNALVGGSIRIERDGGGRSPQKQHITLETFFASGGRALPLGRLFDGTIY